MTPRGRRVVVLAAALAGAMLTARLGLWQLDRAAQKIALQQSITARAGLPPLPQAALARRAAEVPAQTNRRIRLQGHWLAAYTVYLDNRPMDGRVGFYVVTPLALDDGSAVLVERGWVARDPDQRTRIALPPPPPGPVTIDGRITPYPGRLYSLGADAPGPIRQNLDVAAYARETGLALRPLALVEDDGPTPPADGLRRDWPAPAADVQMHYGYAFQWFAMSALIIGLYVWFQLLRPRRRPGR